MVHFLDDKPTNNLLFFMHFGMVSNSCVTQIVNDDSPNLQLNHDVDPNIDENTDGGASKGVNDLVQDLLGKVSATDGASTSGANQTEVIDIINDSETSLPLKRSCPFDEGSSFVGGIVFKEVKIEKQSIKSCCFGAVQLPHILEFVGLEYFFTQ